MKFFLAPWKKSYDKSRQHIKKQRRYFANKSPSSQSYGFSSHPVWMWELDYKESWALKNWCFWTVVLEKTLESPLDCKEIKPVNPKGNQSWIFIGGTYTEALILGHLMGRANSLEKTLNQEDKGTTEDEMVGWNHWLSGHEFEQTSGDNEGQGILVCYSPWVCSSDTTELLNNNSWFSVVFVSGVPTDSKVTQLHMYLFLFKFFSLLGCYIILSGVTCVTQ